MLVILAVSVWPLAATEIDWMNPIGGSFDDPSNWDPCDVPGDGDTAIFDLGQSPAYEVTFGGSVTNTQCIFRTDEVNMDLSGYTYTLTDSENGLVIGESSGQWADVFMTGGSLHTDDVKIAHSDSDSTGIWTVGTGMTVNIDDALIIGDSGDGSMYINSAAVNVCNTINVGFYGQGYLSVTDGATARTTSPSGWIKIGETVGTYGEVYVSGNGSMLNAEAAPIVVGDEGEGHLTIENEAHVHSANQLFVGAKSDSYGEVTISGNESQYISDSVYDSVIGESGEGLLKILDNGYAEMQGLTIGKNETGFGTVELNDSGSSLVASVFCDIGKAGEGHLWVSGGASVSVGQLQAGTESTGYATIGVEGSGSSLEVLDHDAIIADAGWGEMTISDWASVTVNEQLIVGRAADSFGTVTIIAGDLLTTPGYTGISPMVFGASGASLTSSGGVLGQDENSYGIVELCGSSGESVKWTVGMDYVGGDLIVGQSGYGDLYIGEYSDVLVRDRFLDPMDTEIHGSPWVFIGDNATSQGYVTIDGEQAKMTVENSPVTVGGEGYGNLSIQNGGSLHMGNGELWVGMVNGGTGIVSVSGAGSRLEEYSDYDSVIGGQGYGELFAFDGSSVAIQNLIIGQDGTGVGNVVVSDGSSLEVGNNLTIGQYGQGNFDLNSGEFGTPGYAALGGADLSGVNPGELHIGEYGTLKGNGTIMGDVVNLAGIVEPGASVGALTICGDYTQEEDGILYLDIAGDGVGEYDVLYVCGDVTLNGCLGLWIQEGFWPQKGMTFDLIQFNGMILPASNWFSSASWIFWPDGKNYDWQYELNVVPMGDYDYALQLTSLNTVIPEPATLILLGLGGFAVLRRRGRRI